jgi:hypothetical protein
MLSKISPDETAGLSKTAMAGSALAVALVIAVSVNFSQHLPAIIRYLRAGSMYGGCGNRADHFDGGCQTAYVTCNADTNALTAR